jgi:glycosyltransferase involved in cell wall biosynthesis
VTPAVGRHPDGAGAAPHRVLWLTKGLGLGGAERLVVQMAARLDRQRYALDIAYVLPWKDAFASDLRASGIRPICLGARRTIESGWVLRLRRLLEVRDYAVVHTHSPVPAAAARLLAPSSVQLVHTEHNVWERYGRLTYAVNAATYHRNAAVIAVSDGVASSVRSPRWLLGRRRLPPVETLHHGVDLAHVRQGDRAHGAARHSLGIADSTPVIGSVANFTPKKDHAGLLQAAEQVRARIPDVRWLLIGSGPLETELRVEVDRRGLNSCVIFLGMRSDVLELLPALDVFVLGSTFEGLPISLLEAMASGIACVATEVGGIPEVITDGEQGRLVRPGDPRSLAEAVVALLRDRSRREALAKAGQARVEAEFTIDYAVRRTEELYASLLGQD